MKQLKKGMLIVCRSPYNHNDFSISVILYADVGNNKCHIRGIYRLDKGQLHTTMNWSNVKTTLIESVIMDVSNVDYNSDFIDMSMNLEVINNNLLVTIPEYMI